MAAAGTPALAIRALRGLPIALAAAIFVALVAGPALWEYRLLTVLSGSMEPRIPTGAMIVSQPIAPEDLRVGDIITFISPGPEQIVLTHRVIEIVEAGAEPLVRTRGDANSADDPWTARLHGGKVWRTTHVLPGIGKGVHALNRLPVRVLLLWALCGSACVWALRRIWRPEHDRTSEPLGVPDAGPARRPLPAVVPVWAAAVPRGYALVPSWPLVP